VMPLSVYRKMAEWFVNDKLGRCGKKRLWSNFYCCIVHFDDVQNSFHQQMHPSLNI
jgi:hypothetical protein